MKSLLISLEAVFPIFFLMMLGYGMRLLRLGTKAVFDGINKLIFWVFLPVLLFHNTYQSSLSEAFDTKLIVFSVVGILVVFLLGYGAVFFLTKENPKRGVMLQGFFRSNVAFLGVPLATYICGEKALGCASVTVAIVVPLVNVLAVICLERFRHGKIDLLAIGKGILKNPLLIGCALGLLASFFDLKLPALLEGVVSDVAGVATPLAMIVLGAGFTFGGLGKHKKELLVATSAKLVFIPLIAVTVAALLGYRDISLVTILCIFGTPVAVASYAMADQMGGDAELAGQMVVVTSAFCSFTLFLFVFALSSLRLI